MLYHGCISTYISPIIGQTRVAPGLFADCASSAQHQGAGQPNLCGSLVLSARKRVGEPQWSIRKFRQQSSETISYIQKLLQTRRVWHGMCEISVWYALRPTKFQAIKVQSMLSFGLYLSDFRGRGNAGGRMGDGQTMVENLALSLCRQLLRWLPTFSNMPNLNCVEFSYWTCWWLSNMQTECWFGVFHVQPTLVFHRFPRRFPPARSQDGPVTRGGLVGFEALGRWLCGYGAAWVRNAGRKTTKGRWKLHFNGVK